MWAMTESTKADIAVMGLAVMGENLILNMDDHGFTVAVFNRTVEKVDRFVEGRAKGTKVIGAPAAWPHVKEIFQAIAAKVDHGTPCCEWVGQGGAGHYVKMVHNGIEYGDMQLICEAYQLLRDHAGLSSGECAAVFAEWNKGE